MSATGTQISFCTCLKCNKISNYCHFKIINSGKNFGKEKKRSISIWHYKGDVSSSTTVIHISYNKMSIIQTKCLFLEHNLNEVFISYVYVPTANNGWIEKLPRDYINSFFCDV